MIRKGRTAFIVTFLAPSVILYGLFVVFPLLQSFMLSMYRWKGLSTKKTFIGGENFQRLAKDDVFWKALQNNMWLLFAGGAVILVLSLLLSHAMQGAGKMSRALRGIYLFPQVISLVIVATLWQFILNPNMGLLSNGLDQLHLGQFKRAWLSDPQAALPAVVAAFIWYVLGFYIMLFSAGLRSIPSEVNEAAQLDGSEGMHKFWRITWPMLWSVKRVAAIYIVINVMNVFALVYLMTQGGPDRRTEVMLTYLYEQAFTNSRFGDATALAVANFIIAMVLSLILMLVFRRDPQEARR